MTRIAFTYLLLLFACGKSTTPSPKRLELARVCSNPYLPTALGNHWEYDITSPRGAAMGTVVVDVVAVDAKTGRATLRSVESHHGKADAPAFAAVDCTTDGSLVTQPMMLADEAPSTSTAVTLPSSTNLASTGYHWTSHSYLELPTETGAVHADISISGQRGGASNLQVTAGQYSAIEVDHHVQVTLPNNEQHVADVQTWTAENVGIVRASGGHRVISLRRFQPHLPVTADMQPPPPPARKLAAQVTHACTCDPCQDQVGGLKNCTQCSTCECHPEHCGCPNQPACSALPVCDSSGSGCARAGTAGMTAEACPGYAEMYGLMGVAEACREAYWGSLIGGLLSLTGVEDANDFCGRSLLPHDEWELHGEGDAVGVVAGRVDPNYETSVGSACSADPPILRCSDANCSAVNRSREDECFSHHDRDFEFDLAVDRNSPAMKWLAPLNMARDGENVGRSIGVEWEYSFMFPAHTDQPDHDLPQTTEIAVNGAPVTLRTPWPGDTMAVHGPVIADCGHVCGTDREARTEIHPPTAMAWLHALPGDAKSSGQYTLSWRMSSHATFPLDAPQSFRGKLAATLPLPDGRVGSVVLKSPPTCDYLFTDWDIDDLESCKLFVDKAPYLCELVTMESVFGTLGGGIAGDVLLQSFGIDSDKFQDFFLTQCRGLPEAQIEVHGGNCENWKASFSANLAPAKNGVSVALDSNDTAPDDRPWLFGGHADVCVPDCSIARRCAPAANGCGFCTGDACTQPGTVCGSHVSGCGPEVICQTGSCPNGGACVLGKCTGCQPKCDGQSCGSDGCGGTCACSGHGVCRAGGKCVTVCPSKQHSCADGVCVPAAMSCP